MTYDLCSLIGCWGGGKISVHVLREGARFQCAGAEGGQDFSAPESENSSIPPVHFNNDRSLIARWVRNVDYSHPTLTYLDSGAGKEETKDLMHLMPDRRKILIDACAP